MLSLRVQQGAQCAVVNALSAGKDLQPELAVTSSAHLLRRQFAAEMQAMGLTARAPLPSPLCALQVVQNKHHPHPQQYRCG